MKIGLVLDDSLDPPDGVQQYVLTLGGWLARRGHDVHYLVGQTKRQDITKLHSLSRNIKVAFNGNQMRIPLPTSRRHLRKLLADEQFDVLHIQMPYSPWLAHRLILAAGSQTAIVGSFHIVARSRLVTIANYLLGWWLRRSLRRFDSIMAASVPAQQLAAGAYRITSQVVPNLVDTHRYAVTTKPRGAKLRVVYLGRLVARKGCRKLLEALVLLKNQPDLPPFETIIGGKGPLLATLQAYAAQEKLENVYFKGFVDENDKPSLLGSADISVFPSTGGESFGIILVEAMASGQSVVLAGDNSGYRSVLGQQPASLFKPNDSRQLADKLAYYLTNQAARQAAADRMAEIATQFDSDTVGPAILRHYESGLRKRQATGIMEAS